MWGMFNRFVEQTLIHGLIEKCTLQKLFFSPDKELLV